MRTQAILRKFQDMKAKHPDAVLLFRCGNFYMSYDNDAKIVSDVCGVTLTRTSHRKDITAQMAGFPLKNLDTFLPKLVRYGNRVAICEIEDKEPSQQENTEQKPVYKPGDYPTIFQL